VYFVKRKEIMNLPAQLMSAIASINQQRQNKEGTKLFRFLPRPQELRDLHLICRSCHHPVAHYATTAPTFCIKACTIPVLYANYINKL